MIQHDKSKNVNHKPIVISWNHPKWSKVAENSWNIKSYQLICCHMLLLLLYVVIWWHMMAYGVVTLKRAKPACDHQNHSQTFLCEIFWRNFWRHMMSGTKKQHNVWEQGDINILQKQNAPACTKNTPQLVTGLHMGLFQLNTGWHWSFLCLIQACAVNTGPMVNYKLHLRQDEKTKGGDNKPVSSRKV